MKVADVLDHATSEVAIGSKLGIDATKKLPGLPREIDHQVGVSCKSRRIDLTGRGFKRPWPPLIKMDAAVKAKVEKLLGLR